MRSRSRLDGRSDLQVEIAPWAGTFPGNFVTMIPLAARRSWLLLREKGFFAIFYGIVLSKTFCWHVTKIFVDASFQSMSTECESGQKARL